MTKPTLTSAMSNISDLCIYKKFKNISNELKNSSLNLNIETEKKCKLQEKLCDVLKILQGSHTIKKTLIQKIHISQNT